MASLDLISNSWNPNYFNPVSFGSGGDDVYLIPGATKFDGSIDTNGPTQIKVGSSGGYSSTPTISEIQSGSGLNQIIAACNRRVKKIQSLTGNNLGTLTYLSTNTGKIKASDITSIRSKIITIRSTEGMPAYSFPSAPSVGDLIKGDLISHLRKALVIDSPIILNAPSGISVARCLDKTWLATDNGFSIPVEGYQNSGSADPLTGYTFLSGYTYSGMSGSVKLYESNVHFSIWDYISSISGLTVTLTFTFGDRHITVGGFRIWNLYRSDTDDSALVTGSSRPVGPAGDGHDHLINSYSDPVANSDISESITASDVTAKADSHFSLYVANKAVHDGTYFSGGATTDEMIQVKNLKLQLDF